MPVKGGAKFRAALRANAKRMPSDVRKIVKDEGGAMQEQAKRLERYDTGHWRNSTLLAVTSSAYFVSAKVTANAYDKQGFNYGYYQETDGGTQGPNHAVKDAFDTHSKAAIERLKGLVR